MTVHMSHIYPCDADGPHLVVWANGTNANGHQSPEVQTWSIKNKNWKTASPTNAYTKPFCTGMAQMPDGKLWTMGGHMFNDYGLDDLSYYDGVSRSWTRLASGGVGRWYPSIIHIPDTSTPSSGKLLVHGGTAIPETPVKGSQLYTIDSNVWTDPLPNSSTDPLKDTYLEHYYPHLFYMLNGKVFCAGSEDMSRWFNPATPGWENAQDSGFGDGGYASSVMYEPGKIMKCGGEDPAVATCKTYDGTSWSSSGSMNHARRLHNLVILPDGKVLAIGGVSQKLYGPDASPGAIQVPEIWNPGTGTWTSQPQPSSTYHKIPRWYHSVAQLLPNGKVLISGGDVHTGVNPYYPNDPSPYGNRLYQYFVPGYLNTGASRPTITSAPATVTAGFGTFSVDVGSSAEITKVALIRLGTTTHGFDSGQRYVPLTFSVVDSDTISVTTPASARHAPPGYYMLFVMKDASGEKVPSEAKYVKVLPPPIS